MTSADAVDPGAEDDPEQELSLPRAQSGPQPQRLLITLLGDYWHGRPEHLPSAALVALLGEFGISAAAARAALSRLVRRGVLESSRTGRRTGYGLTRRASTAALLDRGTRRIMSFGAGSRPWDGQWRMVVFSVPEERRNVRHAARARLRWLGFAPLYDGVWISPHDAGAEAAQALGRLEVRNYVVMTAQVPPDVPQGVTPLDAWDLDEIRSRYDDFVSRWEQWPVRAREGAVGTAEALRARTELMYGWLHFPSLDPELPAELLPADWPRGRAYEIFTELYDSLGPLAEIRVRQTVGRFAPELAPLVRHHTHRGP
jgi:phenylacetic acid degradation operon negative regulatory protein